METTLSTSPKTDISPHERIAFLDSLRAIAIIMVVAVHTLGYVRLTEHQQTIISLIVSTVSVPVFFVVDGYLFARSTTLLKEYGYPTNNVGKTMFRLLVPWAIFTLFYVAARYVFELSGFLDERLIIGRSLQEVALSAYGSVYAPQLYFLASLFLIRICGPVLRRIVVLNYIAILLLFFCYLIAYTLCIGFISPYLEIDGGQEPILHAIWGIQFYFLGIVIFKTSIVLNLNKLVAPLLLLFLIACLSHSELGRAGSFYFQYSYLISIFLVFSQIKVKMPILQMIGKNTMGVYLIHAPIVLKGVSILSNKFLQPPILSYVAILVSTFIISYYIAIGVKHIPYGSLLFGEASKHPHY